MSREIHYTFVLKLNHEDECWEAAFEDGLEHILETTGYIEDGEPDTVFEVDLQRKVVNG